MTSQVALGVKNLPASAGDKRCRFNPWVGKIPWRKAWQLAPVSLPGKSHGQRSLAGYSLWGVAKELDMTWLLNENKVYLGDIAGLTPDHCRKASTSIKQVTQLVGFPVHV